MNLSNVQRVWWVPEIGTTNKRMLNGLEQNSLFSDLEKSRAKIQERFIRKFIFHQHASLQNALKRGRSIIIFSGEKIAFFLKISHEKKVKLKGVSLS